MISTGAVVTLEDQGEGWFPLAPTHGLRGEVIRVIPDDPPQEPYYLIQLDSPLEVQETSNLTPSGLQLQLYNHVVVRSRWVGVALGSKPSATAQVYLVPAGSPLPSTDAEIKGLTPGVWASCTVAS